MTPTIKEDDDNNEHESKVGAVRLEGTTIRHQASWDSLGPHTSSKPDVSDENAYPVQCSKDCNKTD